MINKRGRYVIGSLLDDVGQNYTKNESLTTEEIYSILREHYSKKDWTKKAEKWEEILRLRYRGHTYNYISDKVGMHVTSVRDCHHRCLNVIRLCLGERNAGRAQ